MPGELVGEAVEAILYVAAANACKTGEIMPPMRLAIHADDQTWVP
jgi:hypothetical protein